MAAELSIQAVRLLEILEWEFVRAGKEHPAHVPDHELAERCSIPVRDVIDAAAELLAAGYLVLADGTGRWLGTPTEARRYERTLRQRALRIFLRRRALRQAMARHAGQLRLPLRSLS